ncbi:Sulfotransferase domain-containing protein [Loktanella sp. DSM 29012]|uniref:sulfotransferase domain-containing protein n=1 Tax=Loktanella sp. DSM 29012 TaxID=1881056 RepID=UPI0008B2D907|nr:sulfotransferase domain-containing protein [Loktanella sp. DSM 29012]SEQ77978.1 Sulfotransferase domain-containing protein [Loktanella sp. DSM 29012]
MARSLKSWLFGHGISFSVLRPGQRARLLRQTNSRASDVYMCSFPRSGNTWTRMIVAFVLDPTLDDVDLDVIDRLVPRSREADHSTATPRVLKNHTPAFDLFPRVIYNVRDGRDATLSNHAYQDKVGSYAGDRLTYIADRAGRPFGLWHDHVRQALAYQRRYPDRFLMLRYEDLRHDPAAQIRRVADFLGKSVSDDRIARIIALTDLDRQRARATSDDPRKAHTLQTGAVGGWRDRMTSDEIRLFEALSAPELKLLGYPLSTDPQEGTG